MTVEEISARLRSRLQEEYGVEEASILMDRPPGGWGELVTNRSLDRRLAEFDRPFEAIDRRFERIDHRFEVLETKFDAKIDGLEARLDAKMERAFRAQTWRLVTATIGSISGLVGAMAIFVAVAGSR